MHLDEVVAQLDEGLAQLGRLFNCDEETRTELSRQRRCLSQELRQRRAFLNDCRRRLEPLLTCLTEHQRQAALLTSRIRGCLGKGDQPTAWKSALELEQANRILAADRQELTRLQTAFLACQTQITRLEHEWATVQRRLTID
jgi:hypothetical protein